MICSARVANNVINRIKDAGNVIGLTDAMHKVVILAVVAREPFVIQAKPSQLLDNLNVRGPRCSCAIDPQQVIATIFMRPLIVSDNRDFLFPRDLAGGFAFFPDLLRADDHAHSRIFFKFRNDFLDRIRLKPIV